MFDFDVAVVIPMAGSSQRFPSSTPKQYTYVLGKPLFLFCVEEFYKLPYIKKICLVCDRVEFVRNIIEEKYLRQEKIVVVNGGRSRHISIKNGLTELAKSGKLSNSSHKRSRICEKVNKFLLGLRITVPVQFLYLKLLRKEVRSAMNSGVYHHPLWPIYSIAEVVTFRDPKYRFTMENMKQKNFYKVVVVHDGVRPLVPEQILVKVISGAAAHGAAGATRPLVSTVIKPMSDGCLETSLDRNAYLLSETPQAFLLQLIMNAYQKCSLEDLEEGTECLQLALKYCGVRAKLIPGPESLWKVTDKKDFYSIVPYVRELSTDVCLLGQEENEVIQGLIESLRNRVNRVECLVTGSQGRPSQQTFNTVVCLHDKEMDQENQMIKFGSVLDVERQGLIIHVVEHSSSDGMQSTSIYELHRTGRNMTKQYEKLKKGVVMIHYLSHGEEKKLIDLIVSLIFTDAQTISGQTLFL